MASLRKRRGVWYARVQWWEQNHRKEKLISLKTKSKVTARERLSTVNQIQDEIIELHNSSGEYSFPWLNETGILGVEYLTLDKAINVWITLRSSQGIAKSTLERNQHSMNTFMYVFGKTIRLSNITTKSIDKYIEVMSKKGYKPNGININLRTIITFFKWAFRRGHITKIPFIEKVKVAKTLPKYISDTDFVKLLNETDEHYGKVFQMYRNTGCRLSEPMLGKLVGNTLVLSAEDSKTRIDRSIRLGQEDITVINELQCRYNSWKEKVKVKKIKYFSDKYSKEFKRICRLVGLENKFHDLRHTFAVRRYLMTRDIYQVMKEMGHSKITTTQLYAEFEINRLQHDFPTIVNNTPYLQFFGKEDTKMEDTMTVYSS